MKSMTYRAFPPYDRLSTFLLLTLSLGSAILPSPATRSRACIHRLCVFRSDAKFEIQMSRTGRRRARSRIHAYVYIQCTYIGIRCNVRTHARGGYLMRALVRLYALGQQLHAEKMPEWASPLERTLHRVRAECNLLLLPERPATIPIDKED